MRSRRGQPSRPRATLRTLRWRKVYLAPDREEVDGGRFARVLATLAIGIACVSNLPPVEVEPLPRPITYLEDVKPVLDRRCVVRHSVS